MARPAKKRPVLAADDSDDEMPSVEIPRSSRSPSRPSPDRLNRYQQGTVREALGLGNGRQKTTKSKYSLAEDLKLIKFVCTEGVKKYDGALCGYGVIMDFCLAYPEVGNRHTEQSLHNRLRTIKKNINTFDIKESWKNLLRPQPAATRQTKSVALLSAQNALATRKILKPIAKVIERPIKKATGGESTLDELVSTSSNQIRGAYRSLASKSKSNVQAGTSLRRMEETPSNFIPEKSKQVVSAEDSDDEIEGYVAPATSSVVARKNVRPLLKKPVKSAQLHSPNESQDEDEILPDAVVNKPARGFIRLYSSDESQEDDGRNDLVSRRNVTASFSRKATVSLKIPTHFPSFPSHERTRAPGDVSASDVGEVSVSVTTKSVAPPVIPAGPSLPDVKKPETTKKTKDASLTVTRTLAGGGLVDTINPGVKPDQRPKFRNEIMNVTLPNDSDDENLINVARASSSTIAKKTSRAPHKKQLKLDSLDSADESQNYSDGEAASAPGMEEAYMSVAPPVAVPSLDDRRNSRSPEFPFRPPAVVVCRPEQQQPVASTPLFLRPASPVVDRIGPSSSEVAKVSSNLPINWNISPVESTGPSVAANLLVRPACSRRCTGDGDTRSRTNIEEDRRAIETFSKFYNISASQALYALFVNNNSPLYAVEWMVQKGLNARPESPISREVDMALLRGGEKAIGAIAASTDKSVDDLQVRWQFLRLGQADLAEAQLPEEALEQLVLELHKHRFTPPKITEP